MSEDADGFTWEGIIRAVTMAGRPDRVFELQLAYNRYFQILDAASRTLRDIRGRISEKDWSGSGADAYRKHYDSLVQAIDTFYEKTSKVVELSGDTGDALARAIADIPLPDMGDTDHLGMHGIQYSDAESGNQVQYHFFRTHRGRYDDGGFLDYVNEQIGGKPDPSQNNFRGSANPNARRYANARDWYATGTRRARTAFGKLLAAYSEQTYAIPTNAGTIDPTGRRSDDSSTFGGSGDGSDAYGAGSTHGGYGGLGAGDSPGLGTPPPGARYGSHGPIGGGTGSATTPGPSSSHAADGSKLASSGGTAAGALGDHSPGLGGGAGIGGVGIGGGAGASGSTAGGYDPSAGYGATAIPAAGIGEGTRGGINPSRGATVGRGAGNTYGGVPAGGGGAGKKERDERQTWLTEDDDDIWRGVPLGPPSVIE